MFEASEDYMTTEQPRQAGPWFRSRSGLVLLAFPAIAGFFLVTEHTAHLLGVLPYLLLLACPLLHFLQWPTLLTVVMFPVPVWMYGRLARREEREARAEFGGAYARYMAATPAFMPRLRRAPARRRA